MEMPDSFMFRYYASASGAVIQRSALSVFLELVYSSILQRLPHRQYGDLTAAIQVRKFELGEFTCEVTIYQARREFL